MKKLCRISLFLLGSILDVSASQRPRLKDFIDVRYNNISHYYNFETYDPVSGIETTNGEIKIKKTSGARCFQITINAGNSEKELFTVSDDLNFSKQYGQIAHIEAEHHGARYIRNFLNNRTPDSTSGKKVRNSIIQQANKTLGES
jgi:hypothetical protein